MPLKNSEAFLCTIDLIGMLVHSSKISGRRKVVRSTA